MLLEYYKEPWDFELLDTGNGFRLERWGSMILQRPDPQTIWNKNLPESEWRKADAMFVSGRGEERGRWQIKKPAPEPWIVKFRGTSFLLRLSPFKHTGLFAEQAAQWEWITKQISNFSASGGQFPISNERPSIKDKEFKILNLFAYTGGASMVLAKAGCQVTHVDASKPAITWANENHKLNDLPKESARWILDDASKFVKREIKRGSQYDGIIMDPPAFGHSPTGATWKFNEDLPELLENSIKLLSPNAKFLVINGYATNSSALALNNLLEDKITGKPGKIEFGELCLRQTARTSSLERFISTGIFARWHNK